MSVSIGDRFFATLKIAVILSFGLASARDESHKGNGFCPVGATIDLTHAVRNGSSLIADNGMLFPLDSIKVKDGVSTGCICDVKPCVAVCPPSRVSDPAPEDLVVYSIFPEVFESNLTLDAADDETPEQRFHVIVWEPCTASISYYLHPEAYKDDEFYLQKDGSLFLPRIQDPKYRNLRLENFCLKLRFNRTVYTPRVCSPEMEHRGDVVLPENLRTAKYIAALVSVPFLIATVIVYSILPELKNIRGITLRCYLCCLVVTYVALAVDRMSDPDFSAGSICLFLGFTIYFSFLASFLWLNVMCLDTWWRCGGLGVYPDRNSRENGRRFFCYSVYAWGLASLMTAICVGMEFSPLVPDFMIRPGLRLRACWFDSKVAEALYLYGPMGLIIVCNIWLFISTSIRIFKYVKKTQDYRSGDFNDEKESHVHNKNWFKLHLKLFVVMGIAWSTEIISWLWEGPKYVWLVTDIVNALQGVFIFVIFVCKRSIWHSLRKRFYNGDRKKLFQDSQLRADIYASHNSWPDLATTQLQFK